MPPTQAGPDEGPAFVAPELPDSAEVWLLRHGETEWSASGQHTGRTDIPLTEAGKEQARAMGNMLGDLSPALVLSSPRRRARDSAELAGLRVDETTEDLAEWDYGDYEGMTTAEIREADPDWTVWTSDTPGGETRAQIAHRADRVLSRVAAAVANGPVVLVGHGHFSRALAARWIGLAVSGGANLLLGTAAPSVLGAQYGVPVIERWNLPNPAA
ncbi:MAG: histidine phosphatase family protein [Jatrophihabitans sp.]|uniref:histidine phosphatase family protein n=1 Tax=Jatrophihabitans sp. TaxID=1932789 RepID=UPI003912CAF7